MGPIRCSETSVKITNLLCVTLQRSEDMNYTVWKPEISQVLPYYLGGRSIRLRTGRTGVRTSAKARDFLLSETSRPALGPPNLQFSPLTPGLNWPGCDVDLSTPSNTEVKNEWSFACAPPVRLHVAAMNSFTFAYTSLLSENVLVE